MQPATSAHKRQVAQWTTITPSWRQVIRASVLVTIASCLTAAPLEAAGVIVVTNRTDRTIAFRLSFDENRAESAKCELHTGDCRPIPLNRAATLHLDVASNLMSYRVVPGAIYCFALDSSKRLTFSEIGLEPPGKRPDSPPAPLTKASAGGDNRAGPAIATVSVKVLFDEAEILTDRAWETRIRRRFDEASRIFREHCFVEFSIVSVEKWRLPASATSLAEALGQFERTVEAAPAQLAVGFLAERIARPKDGHLGGTRGPLCHHLLVHERANQNTERECLELLVHELGHFLGAAHSPEANSVMRPVLGDRFARSPGFQIVFDPLNTMAMCIVSRELAARRDLRMGEISASATEELRRVYFNLDRALPHDPAARQYLKIVGDRSPRF